MNKPTNIVATFARVLLVGGGIALFAPAWAADSTSEARGLVAEAAALLDQYEGDRGELSRAEDKLKKALALNPSEADAYVELARYTMKLSGRLDAPTLRKSEELIRQGITIAPANGNAYVLLGYVLTNAGRLPEADAAFAKAHQYRATSPWLYLNEADLRQKQNRPDLEEKALLELAGATFQPGAMRSRALNRLATSYAYTDYDAAERAYTQAIALDPKAPFPKGNFSAFLRMRRLDLVRSERYAREALALRRYGMARQSLAFTLYLQWADAVIVSKDANRAQQLFAEAQTLEPDLSQIVVEIGYYPRPHPILYALKTKGISIDTMPGVSSGTTPLNVAADAGNQALVAEMIHAGARPDTQGYNGYTSLMLAAKNGNAAVVRLLLAAGADPTLLSSEGKDAETYAKEGNHREAMGLLTAAKATYRSQTAAPPGSVPFKVRYVYRVRKAIPNPDRLKDFKLGDQVMFLRAMTYGDPPMVRYLFMTIDGGVRELSSDFRRNVAWGNEFEEVGPVPAFPASK